MKYSSWKIDLDRTSYRGTLYIIRKCFNSDGTDLGRERKLINVEEIPIYIRKQTTT